MPVNVSAHERNMKTIITIIIIGLVAGIHKGDTDEVYVFVTDVEPCQDAFFDPWSGVTQCRP